MMPSDSGSTPNEPQQPSRRLWRALWAGGAVGGIGTAVLLVGFVLLRFLFDYIGLPLTVGAIAFGLGVAVAVAALDWLME